jgi:hypothetical protein
MGRPLPQTRLHRYREQGIVFPIRVLEPEEANRYRARCDELETLLGGRPRTVEVRQMHLHFRWAYELATQRRVVEAVGELLGPNLLVWATELFSKHPQDSRISIGWHRDRPYMGFDSSTTATAWIALSDSNAANGCLRVIPGPDRGSKQVAQDEPSAIDVVLEAGEMSLHDAEILHGSGPNRSADKRVGFAIRFVTPEARPREGRPPVVVAHGRDTAGNFEVVEPPDEEDPAQAAAKLKQSAMRHLEAILENLQHRNG